MRLSLRSIIFLLLTVVTAAVAAGGLAAHAATEAATPAGPTAPVKRQAAEVPAVEDGAYPDADKIEQERQITVIGGNGLITLVECGPGGSADGLIAARSSIKGTICFKARTWPGTEAFITVKIPEVYFIKGDDHQVKAKLTPENGPAETYDIERNQWTAVGEGTGKPPEALIELRAKP
ncbi:hypothetical protein E1287_29095 [Actinomadura sp. KC06]|uniref:hypothetical protein n=1 Tax=Actinomadura sp. KC06 TaxID=2530369 RepID=UPI00104D3EBB|nr:hypothetical protein [Actinomadura sp. KC06]TDD30537.1 hypothetical protein E1287_29095 [Actinomadura sp. KC06]